MLPKKIQLYFKVLPIFIIAIVYIELLINNICIII